jgi:hypothetical protein
MMKIVFGKDDMVASTYNSSALAHRSVERCSSNISQQTGTQADDIVSACRRTKSNTRSVEKADRRTFWMHADLSVGVLRTNDWGKPPEGLS